jgi:hypothetical protein
MYFRIAKERNTTVSFLRLAKASHHAPSMGIPMGCLEEKNKKISSGVTGSHEVHEGHEEDRTLFLITCHLLLITWVFRR